MVTDLLLCRWIAASFDEGFEKIKDFPLSLGEFFQVSLPFRVVNWAWGECRNRQRGYPPSFPTLRQIFISSRLQPVTSTHLSHKKSPRKVFG